MNDDLIRVKHMIDAAEEIIYYSKDKKREDLDKERLLNLSLVHLLEIFGEAASRVSVDFQKKYPDIPWREIIDMRNRLIHGYFDIDLDIVWKTIKDEIPPINEKLKKIKEMEDKEN